MTAKRFVLLDRDGTLIVEQEYLSDPGRVALLPNAGEGLRRMQALGLGLILVTNQSGIGRGYFDETRLEAIHQRLHALLHAEQVTLDGVYVCPHTPQDNCSCRKPRSGLVETAAQELQFELESCFLIGDKASDIELGQRIGAITLLVRTGYGVEQLARTHVMPDYVADDLLAAAHIIGQLIRPEKS